MSAINSVLDSLLDKDDINDPIVLPDKCLTCKNTLICSVVPTLIALFKIGILISVKQCPFTSQEKVGNEIKSDKQP